MNLADIFRKLIEPKRRRASKKVALEGTKNDAVVPDTINTRTETFERPIDVGANIGLDSATADDLDIQEAHQAAHTPNNGQLQVYIKREDETLGVTLEMRPGCDLVWDPGNDPTKPNRLIATRYDGRKPHLSLGETEAVELTIGLDFGTSSLKAVIHDKVLDKSYAVPFRQDKDVSQYLLPCKLFLGPDGYSLNKGDIAFQDLKLALLSSVGEEKPREHAIAFLALALRRIRAWLFDFHEKDYSGNILWNMTIGLPVPQKKSDEISMLYEQVGLAAWRVSLEKDKRITPELISTILNTKNKESNVESKPDSDYGVEITVVPEIAAQIYGFVSSGAYDPNASNIFLMVDVGAGTVDSTVFRVDRKRGKKRDNFVIFNALVEPFGVMNLHHKRMEWLRDVFSALAPERTDLLDSVSSLSYITDVEKPIPDVVQSYFKNMTFKFYPKEKDPDANFYSKVRTQVCNQTYFSLGRDGIIPISQMQGMPMLLCGGGSRMKFYKRLEQHMASTPNVSWFNAKRLPLEKPKKLVAPGLDAKEYDRLSVAYGLSRVFMGDITYDVPPLERVSSPNYRERYLEK